MKQVMVIDDKHHQALWAEMNPNGRPSMKMDLLTELAGAQQTINKLSSMDANIQYQILSSFSTNVFSLGGDLEYFLAAIRNKDTLSMMKYANLCIDIIYKCYSSKLTTIALVEGMALGGGFEAALSCNIIIAEKGSVFGFPETMFGMFPGMGAYSFLSRKVSPAIARRMVESSKMYTANELYDLGIVDLVIDNDCGVAATKQFIDKRSSSISGFKGMEKSIELINPATYAELGEIASIWVDTAMNLSDRNIRLMEKLLESQNKQWVNF